MNRKQDNINTNNHADDPSPGSADDAWEGFLTAVTSFMDPAAAQQYLAFADLCMAHGWLLQAKPSLRDLKEQQRSALFVTWWEKHCAWLVEVLNPVVRKLPPDDRAKVAVVEEYDEFWKFNDADWEPYQAFCEHVHAMGKRLELKTELSDRRARLACEKWINAHKSLADRKLRELFAIAGINIRVGDHPKFRFR